MAGASITCVGLVHVYRAAGTDTAALRGVDLAVGAGEHVALLGPSGSGKSTLLAVVAGIRQPSAGAVLVGGRDISRLPEPALREYRALVVGIVLQGAAANLFLHATPAENIHQAKKIAPGSKGLPAADLLAAFGLDTKQQRTPVAALSPGRRQAAALAVALANAPQVLVADEPTSQLDGATRDDLLDALLTVTRGLGTTVLVVTHDAAVAARMDRTLHLREGRVGAQGNERERLAVIGADGSFQLPEHLTPDWPAGTLVRVRQVDEDGLHVTRVRDV